ncbi:glycosyltransferase [Thalassotalea sp. HSM 43]|uniref:glycosyltransferase n=1 Tax=Thalassotalea sp. HSM 43 TaxID=2552945 RepID=UPI001080A65E|nr:glycosyltransferase [Thalassotalea sp. HSM 43]QBY03129.1 glycosyltransferase [Thalassotalea sp. HSM 43]
MSGISVIIVCYKSELELRSIVESILFYNDISLSKLEFIVVDNYGLGKEQHIVKSIKIDHEIDIKYIRSEDNLGYGAGNNIGIHAAKNDVICVVNPDVRFVKPIFNLVLDTFKDNGNIVALSGEQISGRNKSYFLRPEFQIPFLKGLINRFIDSIGYKSKFMALSGALTFYDKKLFKSIGLFDENIFLYCEESDVAYRACKHLLKTKFDSRIKYVHLDWDRTEPSPETVQNLIDSVIKYSNKHNERCLGYFLSGYIHSLIKSLYARLSNNQNEANRLIKIADYYRKNNFNRY